METKKWWASLTLWGVATMGLCGLILPLFGLTDYATFINSEAAGIEDWLGVLGNIIGGFVAFYGRFRAVSGLTN